MIARAAIMATIVTSTGCLERGVFRCHEKKQCGPGGYCETTTGACSFADSTCKPSERRYQSRAPEALAGRCVADACPSDPVIEVRGGGAHVCLVRRLGGVACWGAGNAGQLGDGTRTGRSTLAPVAALDGPALGIALGDRHTCALIATTAGNTIQCWGANASAELGDGTTTDRLAPTPGPALTGVLQLVAGAGFTCARDDAGTVWCWGSNSDGQLGSDAAVSRAPSPVVVALPEPAQTITARDRHACAVTTSGKIYCWGSNSQGELGDGTTVKRLGPTLATGLADATAVAAGVAHTCALADARVWCWGANQVGELGDGTTDSRPSPAVVPTLADVTTLAAGAFHTCATKADGTVACWGANQAGQLGEGTTSSIGVPVPANGLQLVAEVAAGANFSCARRKDGTVACWGDNRLGQLGTAAVIRRLGPTPVAVLTDARGLSAAGDHTCALGPGSGGVDDATSATYCWGHNQAGELGDGTRQDRPGPSPLKIGIDAVEIASGQSHTCLRGADGSVWCWGRGSSGQLGTPSLIDFLVPAAVAGVSGATAIAAGGAHTCAVAGGGALCWGAGEAGQLGNGRTVNQPRPVTVEGLPDAIALRLGATHTCALRAEGTVACWGANDHGQLGNDAMAASATPVTVGNLGGVVDLAVGDSHTCAVTSEGAAACWGAGQSGQLGWTAATLVDHAGAAPVQGVQGAVEIATGAAHTCARLTPDLRPETPGTVVCWGNNSNGQLGDGTLTLRPLPVPTIGLTDALALTAGNAHTCALKQDRTLVCWGADDAGQLGEGAPLQFSVPQPTQIPCP